MIDIENVVFNTVATALRTAFPGIFVSGEATPSPSSFPAATIVEMDNTTHISTLGTEMVEKHADLMYQVEVYSNLSSGKKTQCRSIMSAIDTQMMNMGFVRTSSGPQDIPNADTTKYRMVARYRGVVGKTIAGTADKYQIYRR
jgi:hypothetical protein